jgi:chromosomal replication initiation ATPase DnaA
MTYSQIIQIVFKGEGLEYHGFLNNKCRKRHLVTARQLTWHLGHQFTRLSAQAMGDFFNKEHATVLHGIKTVENLCQVDKEFREKYAKYFAAMEKEIRDENITEPERAFGLLLQVSTLN